jgi:hypothetical protein
MPSDGVIWASEGVQTQPGRFLCFETAPSPGRSNPYCCAEGTDAARSDACRSRRAGRWRRFRRLGGICASACGGVLDRRSVRRDVRTSADDEPRFTDACEVHDNRPCPGWVGVLRLPRDPAAEGQEAEVRRQGCVMGSEHGQTRSAHQRRCRGQLHHLASRGQVARRSLLRRSCCSRDRHGADRAGRAEKASTSPAPAENRSCSLRQAARGARWCAAGLLPLAWSTPATAPNAGA